MPGVVAIVVAGGSGKRMGGAVPKQFLPLGGRPILDRTVSALAASPSIDGIVLVLPAGIPEEARDSYRNVPKILGVVDGGPERQDSVRNALAAVPADAEVVLVHDGVRPFVTEELLARCVALARERGAVVPVVPVRETLKEWNREGKTLGTVDRARLFRAQTPQAFQADLLRRAHGKAEAEGISATDDAALVEASGVRVVPIPGEDGNLKITTPEELCMAEGLLRERPDFRVGIGVDAHRLVEGRDLWLGGVRIESGKGLLGHSDGDVLLHAIADAIYGGMGDKDIGHHFPPGDEKTKGISSRRILSHARGRMTGLGFGLLGLDAVVVCESPKIAPIAPRLRASIAGILSIPEERVSLKGKTTEGMGFEGRGEGISAWAVALLKGSLPAMPPGKEDG